MTNPKFFTLEGLYPELMLLSTDAERKDVCRAAFKQHWKQHGLKFYLIAPGFFLGVMVLAVGAGNLSRLFAQGSVVFLLINLAIGLVAAWFASIAVRWLRDTTRASIQDQLAELGLMECTGCGSDLRGCVEASCPQCGQKFSQ